MVFNFFSHFKKYFSISIKFIWEYSIKLEILKSQFVLSNLRWLLHPLLNLYNYISVPTALCVYFWTILFLPLTCLIIVFYCLLTKMLAPPQSSWRHQLLEWYLSQSKCSRNTCWGVSTVAQWVKNLTAATQVTAEAWVRSPAQHSGVKDLALNSTCISFLFYGWTYGMWKFPVQGMNLSCSFNLQCRCFNPVYWAGN